MFNLQLILKKKNFLHKSNLIIKLLFYNYFIYIITFTRLFEDKTKIYWCYGSFPSDNDIKWLLISICLSFFPTTIFLVLIYINLFKINFSSNIE